MNIIDEVAKTIQEVGWLQGNYQSINPDGSINGVCILGAMRLVCENSFEYINVFTKGAPLVEGVIKEQFPERVACPRAMDVIPAFNDHEDTTESDVALVLEKASIIYDEKAE